MSKYFIPALIFAFVPALSSASVTIFGVVDASVGKISNQSGESVTGLTTGSNQGSRLGFRGQEDLGGGFHAGFWMESQLQVDSGNQSGINFQRRSTVSLTGGFGEIRLGRDYTASYLNITMFDPFSNRAFSKSDAYNNFGYSTDRASNNIIYILPSKLGGAYGQVQYAFGEKASGTLNSKQGNYYGGRLGYKDDSLDVSLSYGKFQQVIGASDAPPSSQGRDLEIFNLGTSYKFANVKAMGTYGQEKVKNGPVGNNTIHSLLIGATSTFGPHELRASIGRYDRRDSDNDWNKISFGYGYHLSKRTAVYGQLAQLKNRGKNAKSIAAEGLVAPISGAGAKSRGIMVGLRHSF